jgi:hypothetical protein
MYKGNERIRQNFSCAGNPSRKLNQAWDAMWMRKKVGR